MRVALLVVGLSLFLLPPIVARAHSGRADRGGFLVAERGWFTGRHWLFLEGPADRAALDPNAAGAAVTLLVGSLAVATRRTRR
jgi:hypothetical protein